MGVPANDGGDCCALGWCVLHAYPDINLTQDTQAGVVGRSQPHCRRSGWFSISNLLPDIIANHTGCGTCVGQCLNCDASAVADSIDDHLLPGRLALHQTRPLPVEIQRRFDNG